jgi:hypothetical protein
MKELLEKRKAYFDQMEALDAQAEEGKLSEEQRSEYEGLLTKVEELDKEIKFEEKREAAKVARAAAAGTQKQSKEEKEVQKRFTFGDAMRSALSGKIEGLAKEMHQEGEKEMRAIGQDTSGFVVPSMILEKRAVVAENGTTGVEEAGFVQGVYADTILSDLGATFISGIKDQRMTVLPSVTTQWETEVSDAESGGNAITAVDLTPKRLASYLDVSKQAIMQHSNSLDAALEVALREAVAAKVEYAVFTDDSSNGAYDYLGDGKTPLTNADITALLLAVEEQVLGNNHNTGRLGYAISHDLFTEIHSAAKVSGVNALYNDGQILGRPARFSSQIADITNPVVYYGNWSKVNIGQFGGIEILMDPYTQAIGGKTRMVLNSYWDMKLSQAAAISVGGKTS